MEGVRALGIFRSGYLDAPSGLECSGTVNLASRLRCAHHLGYHREELKGRSWYNLLHPAHIPEVAYKHRLCEWNGFR